MVEIKEGREDYVVYATKDVALGCLRSSQGFLTPVEVHDISNMPEGEDVLEYTSNNMMSTEMDYDQLLELIFAIGMNEQKKFAEIALSRMTNMNPNEKKLGDDPFKDLETIASRMQILEKAYSILTTYA